MGYYGCELSAIADAIEAGLSGDGLVSAALSVGASARDAKGNQLDNGDDPAAAAWDLRSHLERFLKSSGERLDAMAELWLAAPASFIDAMGEDLLKSGGCASAKDVSAFCGVVLSGEDPLDDVSEFDWEAGDCAVYPGSRSELAAALRHALDRAPELMSAADMAKWLRSAACAPKFAAAA